MGKNLLFNWWTPKGYLCHLIAIIFPFLQKQTNRFYLALCVLTLILLPLFYLIVFLHQRFALCTLWISTFLMRWAFPGLFSYSAMQGNEERCPWSKTVFKNRAEEKTILVVSSLCAQTPYRCVHHFFCSKYLYYGIRTSLVFFMSSSDLFELWSTKLYPMHQWTVKTI